MVISLPDTALIEHCLALYDRYAREVVEAFDFCPFAKSAREQGAVDVRVLTVDSASPEALLSTLDQLASQRHTEIGILIFPRETRDQREWQRLVADTHEADTHTPRPHGKQWAMAAFHPDAIADLASPSRLVSFIRRTPDRTIQLVRLSSLAQVRAKDPKETQFVEPAKLEQFVRDLESQADRPERVSTHDRIARANHSTVMRESVARIEAIFASIQAERRLRYQLAADG
jgi:hypothetical protein